MNEQDNKNEYQFTDLEGYNEEYSSAPAGDAVSLNGGLDVDTIDHEKIKQILKKVLIGFGVIVGLVMLYHTFSLSATPKVKSEPIATPTISAAPTVSSVVSNTMPRTDVETTAKLSQLATQQQNLMSRLDEANSQISSLQSQLVGYQETISTLTQSLAETKLQQQQQLSTFEKMTVDLNQVKLIQDSYVKKTIKHGYFVQAIVPGRAWLLGPEGNMVTVGVGTVLPGYGKVVAISPQDGIVQTNSGKMIQISQQDS